MPSLDATAKRKLKSLAHHLKPVVFIGRGGLTDSLTAALGHALGDHELVKIKFNDFKDRKRELLAEMTSRTGSDLVDLVGNIAILYRQNPDERRRRIAL
jgi:RNA-binding protein